MKQITLRANLTAMSHHVDPLDGDGFAGIASGTLSNTTLELSSKHGTMRIDIGPKLPEWIMAEGERMEDARYEVTIRRLRKAPRNGKR